MSVNGVSDLPGMLGYARVYSGGDSEVLRYWREVIGDSRVSADSLNAASPARKVGSRTAPTLLVYAAHDTTVPNSQSRLMESALSAAGAPYQVVVLDGDDHYLSSAGSRLQLLEATDAFLAKYLPVAP
ncbi:MAG: prolyl oligopeptidase family serine peptidase [Caulobacter sp.]|nr:prolyl oligopeptidase family serine peptidase [Caulobacter sp.]